MEIVLTKTYLSNVFQVFHGFFNNTFAVKTKPVVTICFTPNLRHLSSMYLVLLKRFSVFDCLLSFITSVEQCQLYPQK